MESRCFAVKEAIWSRLQPTRPDPLPMYQAKHLSTRSDKSIERLKLYLTIKSFRIAIDINGQKVQYKQYKSRKCNICASTHFKQLANPTMQKYNENWLLLLNIHFLHFHILHRQMSRQELMHLAYPSGTFTSPSQHSPPINSIVNWGQLNPFHVFITSLSDFFL